MERYAYNDAEMNAVIEMFTRSRQAFTLARDSVSQALSILRGVNSAGGDLSSAVDGTVLGDVSHALSQADSVLESLTGLLGQLNEAQTLLSKPGTRPGGDVVPSVSAPGTDDTGEQENMIPSGLLRGLTNLLE